MHHASAPMSRSTRRSLILALCAALAPAVSNAQFAVVRGQVRFRSGHPAAGVAVRVFHQTMGPSGFTFSGQDGMYYLQGIPPGLYALQFFVNGQPLQPWQIQVFPQPMTDIAPYILPW